MGLGLIIPSSAGAQTVIPGVVDITVQIASMPTTVSPPGASVVYRATVGQGLSPIAGTLTVTLSAGSFVSGAGCTGSGLTATCAFGASAATFDIVAATGPAGSQTATATVAATGDTLGLEYTSNNSATATTTVNESSQGVASGYVEPGHSITLSLADGRQDTLAVPATAANGVIVTIKGEDGTGHLCGAPTATNPVPTCHNGFSTTFDPDPSYQVTDPDHPLVTNKTFGAQDPCMGLGGSCDSLYYAEHEGTPLILMPFCTGASGGSAGDGTVHANDPCVNQKYKINGAIWWDVRMTSTDPIELPIGRV
jgi:hypothetical protein